MTLERSHACNNYDGKKTVQTNNIFTKKKINKSLVIQPHLLPPYCVHILLPEMEIKRKLRAIIQLTNQEHILKFVD